MASEVAQFIVRRRISKGTDKPLFSWVLKAKNGRVIARGETHRRRRDAIRACETVAGTAFGAKRPV